MDNIKVISQELNIEYDRVKSAIKLLFEESCTIPFVSRYRKEFTKALDEVQLEQIQNRYEKLIELQKRKITVLDSIEQQGALCDSIRELIDNCVDIQQLEDIYLPFKPKRRTRATIARENGLEPLSLIVKNGTTSQVELSADKFAKNGKLSAQEAIKGAMDIYAEEISETLVCRNIVKESFLRDGIIESKVIKGKDVDGIKYKQYFEFSERVKSIPSNRYLAIIRGENEGFLRVSISPDDEFVLERLINYLTKFSANSYKIDAIKDGYKRLLKPSIENDIRSFLKNKSDEKAIKIFSDNLRQLLLAAPLGGKRVLAIDPGFRSGCKTVCLNSNGELIHNETIYPHPPQSDSVKAMKKIASLVEMYKIEAIAIGDGTATRETEMFIKKIHFDRELQVYVVSESGASIYSASAIAREEFPNYDVTVRGAVSIGRRLIDPLAELVKIDPKSIGVGEYQHDVDQINLKKALDFVVQSCVNSVGVNLNTASYYILTHISGIGNTLAKNITEYRAQNGAFESREQLKKVPRLGAKVFEQAAGFLRIVDGVNPLDNSSVHPESYHVVENIAKSFNVSPSTLIGNKEILSKINLNKYINDKIGEFTMSDILSELSKPSVDPRQKPSVFEFSQNVHSISDLSVSMELNGIVTNITSFGAFVDIGIKENGLIHISNMSDKFVSDPTEVVKLHQKVIVKILEIDKERHRIALGLVNLT